MIISRFIWCGILLVFMVSAANADGDLVAHQNGKPPRVACTAEEPANEIALGRSLVERRMQSGHLHAAYAEVLSLPANQADVALLRADILRRLGRDEAGAWYDALLKTCKVANAHHGLGQLAASRNDWSRAIDEFKQAVIRAPAEARFRNDLGYALLRAGKNVEAEFELQVAHELNPESRLTSLNFMLLKMSVSDAVAVESLMSSLKPSRKEFDDLLRDCGMILSQRHGVEKNCQLDF